MRITIRSPVRAHGFGTISKISSSDRAISWLTRLRCTSRISGAEYNPFFIHGGCGLGKTHLLQGLCKRFIQHHPTKRWTYLTGEEFTNGFLPP